jgi:outer membrane protein TolC
VFDPASVAGYSVARHARDAQDFQLRGATRRLAAEAQTAYLDVAAARAGEAVWEATVALAAEHERVACRLVDAGRATPDALARARADRADVEQREAVAHAIARREDLAQAAAGTRAADAAVRLASASFLPSVAVALDYGYQGRELRFGPDRDFAVASVVLSWNVLNGGRDLARRQGASADATRQRLRRDEVEDLVRLDVRQRYESAVVARAAIGTAEEGVTAARRAFDLVRRRYEEGLASQVELLDARTALTSAELNRVLTTYRYAIRYVDLERAAALRDLD